MLPQHRNCLLKNCTVIVQCVCRECETLVCPNFKKCKEEQPKGLLLDEPFGALDEVLDSVTACRVRTSGSAASWTMCKTAHSIANEVLLQTTLHYENVHDHASHANAPEDCIQSVRA